MGVLFFGTPEAAVPFLEVCAETLGLVGVVTVPDRPKGRGRALQPSAVKVAAQRLGVRVFQPESCRDAEFLDAAKSLAPTCVVVVAYGQILPQEVIRLAPVALNVHFSLLPQLRGPAPVQRALAWGFATTGVTIQHIAQQLDAGDIVAQAVVPIWETDDAPRLLERCIRVGVRLLRDVLGRIRRGEGLCWTAQSHGLATWAPKWQAEDAWAVFDGPAARIVCQARAGGFGTGAPCLVLGKWFKIWAAEELWGVGRTDSQPGAIIQLLRGGPVVATGAGGLVVQQGQVEGRKRLSGEELVRGQVLRRGDMLLRCT
ncbi:MAG: formyltransferase family protein [Armatimonadetes bacterium]|nr:formyltransferase family protein [Armatimonadota bacterium]